MDQFIPENIHHIGSDDDGEQHAEERSVEMCVVIDMITTLS